VGLSFVFHTGPYAKLCGRFDTRVEAQEKAARAALPSLFHKEPYAAFCLASAQQKGPGCPGPLRLLMRRS
jgi:hypothetical protein